jgi:ATP phosphoribosyltransferase
VSDLQKLILALPKGRILNEVMPLIYAAGIEPEADFNNPESRSLRFSTNHPYIDIIRVRSFDVATFVAFGAAQIGIAGNDVLMELDYSEIYIPIDLKIGLCRLVVAQPTYLINKNDLTCWGHIRIATKYPSITAKYFSQRGIQAECIKLNGAVELAPSLGFCKHIVDLVSTGSTLKANGLIEIECIANISSRLIINRVAFKTRAQELSDWIEHFRRVVNAT